MGSPASQRHKVGRCTALADETRARGACGRGPSGGHLWPSEGGEMRAITPGIAAEPELGGLGPATASTACRRVLQSSASAV
jgi:hypothetical protein